MRKCPLRTPADLERHMLLHAATLRDAWPRWMAAAHVPDLTPARDQVFEHFYFAIQAALEGLGVVMGPLALISDELRAGRLLAPISEPALRTSGYFGISFMRRRRAAMLRPLPLFANGSLPPAVWPRPNSRPTSQQIAPNRRSIPVRKRAAQE
jgi:DNA-binding transcriptional LysR family regulator